MAAKGRAGKSHFKKKAIQNAETNPITVNNQENEKKTKSLINQVEDYLTVHFDFRVNVVLNKVEGKSKSKGEYKVLDEYAFNSLLCNLLRNGIPVNSGLLRGLLYSTYSKDFNPFRDYFNSLPAWDGVTDYIDELAETVETTDKEYWKFCFKKWIVAMVACSIDHTVTNHTVVVFSGKQGIGKTTWLQNLLPTSLKPYYYSGIINPASKDTLVHLSECILINLDELEGLNRSELGDLKALITKDSIRIRKPYERDTENYTRRASFAGSVNKSEFLNDMTGNRRFLCFEVEKIDFMKSLNLDKVYSQALYLYNDGFKYWFSPDEVDQINRNNEQFRTVSLEEEWLLKNYEPCELGEEHETRATMDLVNLMAADMKLTNLNSSSKKLGAALNSHGFKSVKRSGRKVYLLKCSPYKFFGDNIQIVAEEDNLNLGQVG